jgi:hypothetical protein
VWFIAGAFIVGVLVGGVLGFFVGVEVMVGSLRQQLGLRHGQSNFANEGAAASAEQTLQS